MAATGNLKEVILMPQGVDGTTDGRSLEAETQQRGQRGLQGASHLMPSADPRAEQWAEALPLLCNGGAQPTREVVGQELEEEPHLLYT